MLRPASCIAVPWLLAAILAPAQQIDRLDPGAARILRANAQLERIATGLNKWTEGPVWIPQNGFLLFAEIPANSIDRWSPSSGVSVFLHPSGYQGSTPYNGPEPGSNGMTLDRSGRLTVAGHARRNVWRLESISPNAQITVLADSFEGKPLNSPNDLVYRSDGSLYFTDPPYGLRTQGDQDPEKKLSFNGVFRLAHARDQKPGAPPSHAALQPVIRDLSRPNGIAFSPDEKTLYVSDSGRRVWMRYAVHPDGSVGDGAVLLDPKDAPGRGSPDGIKVDTQGNLYGSGPGGIWIISPSGKHLATIHTPETAANLAWGGPDNQSLYITASTSLYRIRLNIPGLASVHH